jgi:very-short-patch-repair endonuclease
LTRQQEIVAAGLYAGEGAQIAGLTALELHGFRYAPKDRAVHLIVPSHRRIPSRPGVKLKRTDRLDRNSWSNGSGPRICSPARAVIDALKGHQDRQKVRAVLAEAVQRNYATVRELARELEYAQRNGTALLREVLAEVADGARSAPEAQLRQLIARSKILPKVRWNPKLPGGLPTPDGYIEEADMALEVDSREFHLSPDDWEKTLKHHNELAAAGILVLHFTPKQIREEPDGVLRQIENAYGERRKRRTAA